MTTPSKTDARPYAINLDPLFDALERIDLQPLVDATTDPWYNQTLCQVNDSVVRLGVVRGEYHWHKHDNEDEFFYVVDGRLIIELDDQTVELAPRQGLTVPKGVMHKPTAPTRTIILMIEQAGIQPTGDLEFRSGSQLSAAKGRPAGDHSVGDLRQIASTTATPRPGPSPSR